MISYSDPRQEQDFANVLSKRVLKSPDKTWIVMNEESYSYAEIDDSSGILAAGLAGGGVKAGEPVLVMLPNVIEYIWTWCALSKLGALQVPLNTSYRGTILSHILNDSGAKVILVDASYLEYLEAIAADLTTLEIVYVLGEIDLQTKSGFTYRKFEELLTTTDAGEEKAPRYLDLMSIMYTSGTTGASKGATITHAHAYEYANNVVQLLSLREDDVYYAPLPLFHIAGQFALVYSACIAGATAILPGKFSARAFWNDIRYHKATTTFLLGAMANFLHRQDQQSNDSDNPLERVLMVPLIPETQEFKTRFNCLVSTTWASTETNCPVQSSFELVDNKSCGRLASDRFEVRLVDEDEQEVLPGVPGEALVRAKKPWIISNGYWNHPEWTANSWRNQWFHTGDILTVDDGGNYYFVDRSKDSIRRRGENISSVEVEREINAHPDVLECAVFPVESIHTEQEVMAVIVPKEGRRFDPAHLIRFLETRMAYFMVPRYMECADVLPKTSTGKIQKFVLREKGVTITTWDREVAGVNPEG